MLYNRRETAAVPQPATCILNPHFKVLLFKPLSARPLARTTCWFDVCVRVCVQRYCAWCTPACQKDFKKNPSPLYTGAMRDIEVSSLWSVFYWKTSQHLQMWCTLLIESQNANFLLCLKGVIYVCDPNTTFSVILKCWFRPFLIIFEKPDLLLNQNYTVTHLEVAFLLIVLCELCWRESHLKGLHCQMAAECKTR